MLAAHQYNLVPRMLRFLHVFVAAFCVAHAITPLFVPSRDPLVGFMLVLVTRSGAALQCLTSVVRMRRGTLSTWSGIRQITAVQGGRMLLCNEMRVLLEPNFRRHPGLYAWICTLLMLAVISAPSIRIWLRDCLLSVPLGALRREEVESLGVVGMKAACSESGCSSGTETLSLIHI